MAFTVFQSRTIQAWRENGYRVVSQTLMHDHSYEMVIQRLNGPQVTVMLLPTGRYHRADAIGRRRVA